MLVSVGFLLMLAGVVFTLQGVGVLGGSVMSGVTFWAVAGPVIALAGLALVVIGLGGYITFPAGMMAVMVPDILEPTSEIRGLCTMVVRDLHEVRDLMSAS